MQEVNGSHERVQLDPEATFHLVEDLNRWRGFAHTALRVVHDLDSPLSALKMLNRDLGAIPGPKRALVEQAILRVHELSVQLLDEGKAMLKGEETRCSLRKYVKEANLASLVDEVVAEKRLQFRRASKLEILVFIESARNIHLEVCAAEFKAVISNILNNAIEALPDYVGKVTIAAIPSFDTVELLIADNGSGIAPWLKNKLGTPFTTAKPNGNGLGLYFAKLQMEMWKGKLSFHSKAGKGTEVSIVLPRP